MSHSDQMTLLEILNDYLDGGPTFVVKDPNKRGLVCLHCRCVYGKAHKARCLWLKATQMREAVRKAVTE
jgi:hypothetical protein